MDDAELSPEEKAFVAQYRLLSESSDEESVEEKQVERELRSSRLFNTWIGFLAIVPIVLSLLFSVIADRVLSVSENASYKELLENYNSSEVESLTGLDSDKVGFFALLGDNMALVILGIFACFGLLIAFSYLIRYSIHNLRSKHAQKARESNSK